MNLYKILNKALELINTTTSTQKGMAGAKWWANEKETLYVSNDDISNYNQLLELCYSFEEKIHTRFTREKIYKHIESNLLHNKKNKNLFNAKKTKNFFKKYLEIELFERYIVAPISGVRLDSVKKINISAFEIGKADNLNFILSNDTDGYYISVKICNIYDELIAIEEAKNKFLDFIRLIVFLSGKNDKKVILKIGLPSYPSISHDKMYVETSSYQILKNIKEEFISSTVKNTYVEKIPVDNDFFCKNDDFNKIFNLYERRHLNKKISKMEARLLNASIALGESSMSKNIKNSIIYTSMALEILFSYDEGSLYQKSIGEKLSDTFAFIVGEDKESRLNASKTIKVFYRLRSALVHGGETKINNDYIGINMILRAIINTLLNNEKYKHIKNIDQLYIMVKDAQYSY